MAQQSGHGTAAQVYENTCLLRDKQDKALSKLIPDIPNPCSLQQAQAVQPPDRQLPKWGYVYLSWTAKDDVS